MQKAIAAIGLVYLALAQVRAADDARKPRSITVTGTAVVRMVPDEVTIRLRIETLDKDVRKSKADCDAGVKKLLALAKEMQIETRDVQTANAVIASVSEKESDRWVWKGYKSTVDVLVKLRQLGGYDEFIARAVEGSVLLEGIGFSSSQAVQKRGEARLMALRAAREKAAAMAAELDQKIGPPLSVVEEGARSWSGFLENTAREVTTDTAPDATVLAPGQIDIFAQVTVEFELRDAH